MQRSRSGSRLIETAFVSRLPSSLEDLDEVDRLANHPVLRPSPTSQLGRLRKSRSEMGGSVGRGLSVWGQNENRTKAVSKSGQNSPVTPSHFGCRTVGVAMMIKSGKRYKASQSSADLHYARSPSGLTSPLTVTSDSSTPPIPPRRITSSRPSSRRSDVARASHLQLIYDLTLRRTSLWRTRPRTRLHFPPSSEGIVPPRRRPRLHRRKIYWPDS